MFILRRSCHDALLNFQAPPKAELGPVLGHVLSTGDAKHPHLGIVPQTRKQLGRDEEILTRVLAAGNFDHALVDHALVAGVHALIDLVDDAKRGLGHGLEGHEEENGGDGALATGLAMGVELLEGFVFSISYISIFQNAIYSRKEGEKTYRNLTIMSKAHWSKSSVLLTRTSPAQLICSKL